MKYLLIVLIFISSSCFSQTVFRVKMNVLEVYKDTSYCTQDTLVVWGEYKDTLGFVFMDKVRVYCDIPPSEWNRDKVTRKCKQKVEDYIFVEQRYSKNVRVFAKRDQYNEKHIIRFVFSNDGYIIFITNLENGYPNYTLCFGPYNNCFTK